MDEHTAHSSSQSTLCLVCLLYDQAQPSKQMFDSGFGSNHKTYTTVLVVIGVILVLCGLCAFPVTMWVTQHRQQVSCLLAKLLKPGMCLPLLTHTLIDIALRCATDTTDYVVCCVAAHSCQSASTDSCVARDRFFCTFLQYFQHVWSKHQSNCRQGCLFC